MRPRFTAVECAGVLWTAIYRGGMRRCTLRPCIICLSTTLVPMGLMVLMVLLRLRAIFPPAIKGSAKDNGARDADVRYDAPLTLKRSHRFGGFRFRLRAEEVSARGRGARTRHLAKQGMPGRRSRRRRTLVLPTGNLRLGAECAKTNSRWVRGLNVCNRKRGYRVCAPEGARTQSRLSNHKTCLTRSHEYTA